jgi:hypothetical protein
MSCMEDDKSQDYFKPKTIILCLFLYPKSQNVWHLSGLFL